MYNLRCTGRWQEVLELAETYDLTDIAIEAAMMLHLDSRVSGYYRALTSSSPADSHYLLDAGNFELDYRQDCDAALHYFGRLVEESPAESSMTALGYDRTGDVYNALGDGKKALEYYYKAAPIHAMLLDKCHEDLAVAYGEQGVSEYEVTLKHLIEGISAMKKVYGSSHPAIEMACNSVGDIYVELGRGDKAQEYYHLATRSKGRAKTGYTRGDVKTMLATLQEFQIGLKYSGTAVTKREPVSHEELSGREACEKALREEYLATAACYFNIGSGCYAMTFYDEAMQYLESANIIYLTVLGQSYANINASDYKARRNRLLDNVRRKNKVKKITESFNSLIPWKKNK